jgi:DUF971 family protein
VAQDVWPTEIWLAPDKRSLRISFEGGEQVELTAELLRVESPSAEVQGHGPAERKVLGGKRNVHILRVDPVGNYAVRLIFDDGHSTGIYGWRFLLELGRRGEDAMRDYEARLIGKGLSRDRPGVA